MKLPYLFFDCLIILTCWKMLPSDKSKLNFTAFWAINPVVIYGTYMFGQFDLIPSFFVILACYFSLQRGKERFACLSIAAGCLFKIFPIIFLPLILLISSRNLKDFIRLSFYGVFPVLLFYGVFYLISGNAVIKIFTVLMGFSEFSVDYGNTTLRFCQFTVYCLVCFHVFNFRKEKLPYPVIIQCFIAIYFAAYWGILISFEPHRFLWVLPFLVLFVQEHSGWKKPFYVLIVLIFLLGLRPRASAIGIFAPIYPELFLSFPSLKDITGFLFDQKTYYTTIKFLFISLTGVWVLSILRNLYKHKPSNTV